MEEKIINSILKKYRKEIWGPFISAIKEYELIKAGDRIAVCLSGGKDSALLAVLMKQLQSHSDYPFEVRFISMDPGYSAKNREKLEENCRKLDIDINIFETNIFSVAEKTEKNPCYLCARMRRGHLYSYAKSLGCNKIALGHHFSDVIETTLMGMLWGAQIQGMLPKLHSTNYEGMELIRPLYKVHEDAVVAWARYNDLDFLSCACSMTEKALADEEASKRRETKRLIGELKKTNPDVEKCIFNSIHRANVDTLIGYKLNDEMHSFLDRYEKPKPTSLMRVPSRETEIRDILEKYGSVPEDGNEADEYCMRCALELAELAKKHDETPVGCVILRDGKLISGDFNGRESLKNGLYHAEIGAISKACELLGGWRLTRCTLYVTIEPCPMCAGAIWAARVPRVVIGSEDPKAGFYGSVADINSFEINHKPEVVTGVLRERCSQLISSFFQNKRKQRSNKSPEK